MRKHLRTAAPIAAVATLCLAPAQAALATTPQVVLDAAFVGHVRAAASAVLPKATVVQQSEWSTARDTATLSGSRTVYLSDVGLALPGGGTVIIERQAGAQAKATAAGLGESASDVRPVTLTRPSAGIRTALLHTDHRRFATITRLAWTERTGVDFIIMAKGATETQVRALAGRLPSDATRIPSATATYVRTLDRAPATRSSNNVPLKPFSTADGFVAGAGDPRDDFGDESDLSNHGNYWHSNYVALWQGILWAEYDLTQSQVDCQFGPDTEDATNSWQGQYQTGGSPGGRLDSFTREAADDQLKKSSQQSDGSDYVHYVSANGRYVLIHRNNSASSYRYDPDLFNESHGAYYRSATYRFC